MTTRIHLSSFHVRSIPVALLVILSAGFVWAAGPRLAGDRHFPTRWLLDQEQPFIQVEIDAGDLSATVSEQQVRSMAQYAMTLWESAQYIPLPGVDYSSVFSATGEVISLAGLVQAATGISFSGPIAQATDITSVTDYQAAYYENLSEGNVIQFITDRNGSVLDALYGVNARKSLLGLSENFIFEPNEPANQVGQIALSNIILNGRFLDEHPTEANLFRSVIIHEVGHALGLDHSQFYSHFAWDGYQPNDRYLPIMFPIETGILALDNQSNPYFDHPRFDDRASLALLYPHNSNYRYGNLAQIYGKVVLDATKPVLGANVVARKKDDISGDGHIDELEFMTSCVSDFLAEQDGSFFFGALPEGEYEIWVEPIRIGFNDYSSIGPYSETESDKSFSLRALREYWSLPESATPALDNRSSWTRVSVGAQDSIDLASPFIIARDVQNSTEEQTQLLGDRLIHFGGVGSATDFTDDYQFTFQVSPADLVVIISVTPENSTGAETDLNLYVRRDDRVTRDKYDIKSTTPSPGVTEQIILATGTDSPPLPGVYFIGVENAEGAADGFQISVERTVATPTPTMAPTPTPTPPFIVESAYLAGLNEDATTDNFQRFGGPGTPEALAEGNLVGSPPASQFIIPGGTSTTGYFVPAYDTTMPGSLIDSNLESGDTLLVAAIVSRVTSSIVQSIVNATPEEPLYIEALRTLGQWLVADFLSESATEGVLAVDASGRVRSTTGIAGVAPTSATGVVLSTSPLIRATDELLVIWDGRKTSQRLQIAQNTLTTVDLIGAASVVVTSPSGDISVAASPIGVDLDGPQIWSTTDTPSISVPVIRRPWPGNEPDRYLYIYETPGGIINELIAGDIVLITGFVEVRENLDGEAQPDGDLIDLQDISLDFSGFGGQASPYSATEHPLLGEVFIETVNNGLIFPVRPPVSGVVQYLATGTVASVTDFMSQGDYSIVPLTLYATDDVTAPTSTTFLLRVDTSPLTISSVTLESEPPRTVKTEGVSRTALFLGDELLVRVVIELNGDPPDAPIVTADLSAVDPTLTSATTGVIQAGTGTLRLLFKASVTSNSVPNEAASVVITASDDAGNVSRLDSADLGMVVAVRPEPYVEPTPTPFQLYTPTPTPTATPTPHLLLPAGNVIVAASNADAVNDNRGYPRGLTSRGEGNLVGSASAQLFAVPGNPTSRLMYNPDMPGSLIDANVEIGDTLMAAAVVSRITPELVEAVANAIPSSTEHENTLAEALSLVFARITTPEEQLLIPNATAAIYPTDVTGVVGPAGIEPDSLLFIWDGYRTEPPLLISSATTFNPQPVLSVYLSEDPSRYETKGSPIGTDLDGPELIDLSDPFSYVVVFVIRDGMEYDYSLSAFLEEPFELRQGDQITLLSFVDVHGNLDGESADYGDFLTRNDIRIDLSALGGPDKLGPENVALLGFEDLDIPEEAVGMYAILIAESVVGSVTDVITSGPFETANIVLSITADVTEPYVETIPLRLDTLPPSIIGGGVYSQTAMQLGENRYAAVPGNILVVTGTVQLNGDPMDGMTVSLEAPWLDTGQQLLKPSILRPHLTLSDTADAAFEITLGENAITTDAASLIFRATDDAGNSVEKDLSEFNVTIRVQNGPTPTATNTPTALPTPQPSKSPSPTQTPTRYHQYTPTPTATGTPKPP
ncbi:MAG: hypothetical protein ABIH23_27625, partial [bacterium]